MYNIIASEFFDQNSFLITSLPMFMTATYVVSTRSVTTEGNERVIEKYGFWKTQHPHLNNDDENQVSSYRATYRMSHEMFDWLVNELMTHNEFDLLAHNAIPAYIQIATCLIRMANSHQGYRLTYLYMGVSHGSFTNFTRRTLKAIKDKLGHLIEWPENPVLAAQVANNFEHPISGGKRLPGVIGAVDGKIFVIHSPSPPNYAAMFRDRKNRYSVKLTAVCSSDCKFTYIRVGDSGKINQTNIYI